jgi:hypothetical protein
MKRIRLALTALLVGGFMFATPSPAFAEQAFAEVTCAKGDGEERTFPIGWDNSNSFFEGKGDIPRLYCEGGFSQPYNFYVRDNLPPDSPLRWYNGIAPVVEPTPEPTLEPTPEPSLEPTLEPSPEPVPSIEPSLNPEPTPTPEPSQSESPSIEPTPEATESTEPVITPTVEPEPAPTPSVSEIAPVPVVEPTPTPSLIAPTPTPSESIQEVAQVTPEPTPSEIVAPDLVPDLMPTPPVVVIDQTVALEVPALLDGVIGITAIFEAAEAFMNIGSDMTPEQRDESQSVVVAAVIVGQLAMRKTK